MCRERIRTGSRSFHLASLFLPDAAREAALALYGFCRLSDDMIDLEGGRGGALENLSRRLDAIYAQQPFDDPADRALCDAVIAFGVPRSAFDALIEGLSWDAAGRRYETLEELFDYAARVAGSVGAMMSAVMGARSPELAARATDLGAAMQLTNIARDVGEDARAGRIYLPLRWLEEAGIDPEAFLASPAPSDGIRAVVMRLLASADVLYRRADSGIAGLDRSFRPAIAAARRLYAGIGAEIARNGYDSVSRRAMTSTGRRLALLSEALVFAVSGRSAPEDLAAPPLAANAFLVADLVAAAPGGHAARGGLPPALGVFAMLRARDQALAR